MKKYTGLVYGMPSILGFGKFKDYTIEKILEAEPDYIVWCALNLDHFYVDEPLYYELVSIDDLKLTEKVKTLLYNKTIDTEPMYEENEFEDDFIYNEKSYGRYSGTYAQDVEGLSDNFIDDVLDGEPDAYWNID